MPVTGSVRIHAPPPLSRPPKVLLPTFLPFEILQHLLVPQAPKKFFLAFRRGGLENLLTYVFALKTVRFLWGIEKWVEDMKNSF